MPIEIDLHNNTSQIKVEAKSNEPIEMSTGCSTNSSRLEHMIRQEIADRIAGDETLQLEIDEIILHGARYLLIDEKEDGSIDLSLLNEAREVLDTKTITLTQKIIKDSILDYEHSKIIYTCNDDTTLELDISDIVDAIVANTTAITNETTRAEAVEANLQSQIDDLGGDTQELREDLEAEITRATGREAELQTSIDNEGTARQNFDIAIDARVTTLEGGLATEIQDRIDADNTLQSNINSEASTRATEITRVEGLISSEATTRANADTTLQTNIDNEASARASADSTLQSNIDSEASTRASEITRVEGLISDEASARSDADDALDDKIDLEIQNRIDDVDAEETRAKGVESTLDTKISDETTRATTAENALNTRIDNLDLPQKGASGSYIKLISQTNGLVDVTAQTFDTSLTNADDNNAPTSKTVKDYVDTFGGKIDTITMVGDDSTPLTISNKNVEIPSVRTDTNVQGLSSTEKTNAKTNLDLQNVDNTSDLNKPISTATQSALNLKADTSYVNTELAKKQNVIDVDHKLDADLVDDSTSTNKFVTSSLIDDINANTSARHTHSNKSILDNTTASFTTEDETKLDGIETGAQVNVIESISINGTTQTITDKNVDLPTIHDVSLNTTTGSESITVDNSTLNVVTRDTNQTISGAKTFTTDVILQANLKPSTNGTRSVGTNSYRFNEGFINNLNTNKLINSSSITISLANADKYYFNTSQLMPSTNNSVDLGRSDVAWRDVYLSGDIKDGTYTYTLPDKTGTFALVSDIPTKTSDITNDGDGTNPFITNATAQIAESQVTNLVSDLNSKVDKVTGMGLSHNDFTDTLKNKLDGIEANADVNIIESISVNNSALTPDANKNVNITVPTKTSDITNDSGFITKAVDNLDNYTKTSDLGAVALSNDYTDLDNKPTIGNAILTIQKNSTSVGTFTANATSNETINIDVPTKFSDITNDTISMSTTTGSETITIDGSTLNVATRDTTQTLTNKTIQNPTIKGNVTLDSSNANKLNITSQSTGASGVPTLDITTYTSSSSNPNKGLRFTLDTNNSGVAIVKTFTGDGIDSNVLNTYTFPNKSGTLAMTSDLPTKLSDLNDDLGVVTNVKVLNTTNTTAQSTSSNEAIEGSGTINLHKVSKTGSYNDLLNKPTIGDATLTIQKNSTTIDTFSANATSNKTIDISVPTKTSDVTNDGDGTSPFATEDYVSTYGGKIDSISVNGTTQTIDENKNVDITMPTKTSDLTNDGDGTNAFITNATAQITESQVTNLTTDLSNKQDKIDSSHKLSSDLVDDTNKTHRFVTAGDLTDIANNTSARHTHTNKALLDTYTQTEVNLADAVAKKHSHSNKSILDNITSAFTTEQATKLAGIATGAEVNVQSDWSVSDNTSDAFIKNKPTKTSDFTNDGNGDANGVFTTKKYVDDADTALDTAITTHTSNTSNPHSVTASQVGLGNVVNTGDSATPVSGGTTKFTTGGAYTLQTNITNVDNKLDVNVHTIDTSDSEFIYDTTNPSTLLKKTTYKNLKSGTSGTKTEAIPLADSSKDGLMSHTDYNQIQTNTSRIEQLEGQTKRLLYSDSTNPSQQDIQDFVDDYLESIGITPSPSEYTGIAVVIANTYHIWHYYNDGTTGWKDDGLDTVTQFTNSISGIILGSTIDGKVFAENDGTGSVNGWDALKTRVSNVETGMVSNVAYDTTNKKFTKTINGVTSDIVTKATLKADLDVPTTYLKTASVSDTTLTLTKQDNSTVTFSDKYPTSFSWTNGTTSGPTGTLSGANSMTSVSFGAIPSASTSQSGVVTTGSQTFTGQKSFDKGIRLSDATNGMPLLITGDASDSFITINPSPNTSNNIYFIGVESATAGNVNLTLPSEGGTFVTDDTLLSEITTLNQDSLALGVGLLYDNSAGQGAKAFTFNDPTETYSFQIGDYGFTVDNGPLWPEDATGSGGTYPLNLFTVNNSQLTYQNSSYGGGGNYLFAVSNSGITYKGASLATQTWVTSNDKYHTRSYSSGLKISTGTNVDDMYVPYATSSQAGAISTVAQTFSGNKTFLGDVIVGATARGGSGNLQFYDGQVDDNGNFYLDDGVFTFENASGYEARISPTNHYIDFGTPGGSGGTYYFPSSGGTLALTSDKLANPYSLGIKVNSESSAFVTYDGSATKTLTIKPSTTAGAFTIGDGTTTKTIQLAGTFTDNNYYPTSFAWTNGTTSGPTGSLTGTGMSAVSFGAIPSASASYSGVVTTGAQTFAGRKTFNDYPAMSGIYNSTKGDTIALFGFDATNGSRIISKGHFIAYGDDGTSHPYKPTTTNQMADPDAYYFNSGITIHDSDQEAPEEDIKLSFPSQSGTLALNESVVRYAGSLSSSSVISTLVSTYGNQFRFDDVQTRLSVKEYLLTCSNIRTGYAITISRYSGYYRLTGISDLSTITLATVMDSDNYHPYALEENVVDLTSDQTISGGKAFIGTVGNTQTTAGVYLGLDTNSSPNATLSIVSANNAAYIDMGKPNEDYGFRIIKWDDTNNTSAQLVYGSGETITVPKATGTMALTSDIPSSFNLIDDILDGSANKYAPYSSKGAGHLYTGTSTPTNTNRLNYDGNFYATNVYAGSTLLTGNTGTVTSVSAGTGLSISGTASTTPIVNIASGYKLPTTTEWGKVVTTDTEQTITGKKTFTYAGGLYIGSDSTGVGTLNIYDQDVGEYAKIYSGDDIWHFKRDSYEFSMDTNERTLIITSNGTSKYYSFPNNAGTVALTSDLPQVIDLRS